MVTSGTFLWPRSPSTVCVTCGEVCTNTCFASTATHHNHRPEGEPLSEHPAHECPDPNQLLTVADIAAHIGANEATVRDWIRQGQLAAAKFPTRIGYRIRRADYDDFLHRRLTAVITRQLLSATPNSDALV